MRKAILATSALVAFALATYACGSDDDTNSSIPSNPDSGKTSSGSSGKTSSGTSGDGTSSGTSGTSSSGTSGTSSSGTSGTSGLGTTGGVPPLPDSGTVADASSITDSGIPDASESDGAAGALCQVGSIQESETNDTEATADVITGDNAKFCGSASTSDTDYITFTLPIDANSLNLAINTSDVLLVEGTVDGQKFAATGQDAGNAIPFVPGGKYVLKATTTVAKADYIVQVNITHSPASTTCKDSSTKEAEDNSTTPNTIEFKSPEATFCGVISTDKDVDKFQFTFPDAVKTFKVRYDSTQSTGLSLKLVDPNGKSYELTTNTEEIAFVKNKPYVVTASSTKGNNGYLFTLTTTQ